MEIEPGGVEGLVACVRERRDGDLDVGVVELPLAGEGDDDARDVRPGREAIRSVRPAAPSNATRAQRCALRR